MLNPTEITIWHWIGFIIAILLFLALDLGVFHKRAHVVRFKEALGWTIVWFTLAMLFTVTLFYKRNKDEALEFFTGYIIELSLSMDNVFVIAVIFGYFRVPSEYQHRVLFWGILGALIMRGIMIGIGVALISAAHWVLYIFGAFLIYSGIKMVTADDEGVHPEKNPLIKIARRFFPISNDFDGQRFITVVNQTKMFTPLVPVLIMVETTDLIFALDSIPAIFAVTQKPFIVFTSNVFAILGLRSLYFVLAGAIQYFRYLKYGLSLVLVFIGLKMLIAEIFPINPLISLVVVGLIIATSIIVSLVSASHKSNESPKPHA